MVLLGTQKSCWLSPSASSQPTVQRQQDVPLTRHSVKGTEMGYACGGYPLSKERPMDSKVVRFLRLMCLKLRGMVWEQEILRKQAPGLTWFNRPKETNLKQL